MPWLAPSRWRHDPLLQHKLVLMVVIHGAIIVAGLVFFTVFLWQQRQRLRRVEALLRDYVD